MLPFLISFAISAGITGLMVFYQIFQYRRLSQHPWHDVFSHKGTLIAYVILRMLVIFSLIRSIFRGERESMMYCALALILFCMPMIVERWFQIEFSPVMEVIVLLFIYAAEILGEVEAYYVLIPGWDTALHTTNGFLCAAIGFCIADMLNRSEDVDVSLSPFFLAVVGFCFSMTVGVLWEFLEFSMDYFGPFDAQKDTIIQGFYSVTLDASKQNIPIEVRQITRTIIETADGAQVAIEGGYLDIGIIDTMKDLIVNCIGAIVFCGIGFLASRFGHHPVIRQVTGWFIPIVKKPRDILKENLKSDKEILNEMLEENHRRKIRHDHKKKERNK